MSCIGLIFFSVSIISHTRICVCVVKAVRGRGDSFVFEGTCKTLLLRSLLLLRPRIEGKDHMVQVGFCFGLNISLVSFG